MMWKNIQITPTTVTNKSYRFLLDCRYPLGVNAMFFMMTSTRNMRVQIIEIVTKVSVVGSSFSH